MDRAVSSEKWMSKLVLHVICHIRMRVTIVTVNSHRIASKVGFQCCLHKKQQVERKYQDGEEKLSWKMKNQSKRQCLMAEFITCFNWKSNHTLNVCVCYRSKRNDRRLCIWKPVISFHRCSTAFLGRWKVSVAFDCVAMPIYRLGI